MKSIFNAIIFILIVAYSFYSWRSNVTQEIRDEYVGYAHRYGATASREAVRNAMQAYGKQLHALRTTAKYEFCAQFIRGTAGNSKPVDEQAEKDFRSAVFALTEDSNQDPSTSFDPKIAKSISSQVWLSVLEKNGLPQDISIVVKLMKSSEPEDQKIFCELGDDFYQYFLVPKNSNEMLHVGRLWLSTLGG